jgi:hypothetical protein
MLTNPLTGTRALLVFAEIWLRTKSQPFDLLHHRDLINHENSLLTPTGRLALIDFGQARLERRWVLMDVVDLAFDYDLRCNDGILRSCIYRLAQVCPQRFAVRDQVRIALLRRLLHPSRFYSENTRVFLRNCLLNNRLYERWFTQTLPRID